MFECKLVSETFGGNFLADLDSELELFIGAAHLTMKPSSTLKETAHFSLLTKLTSQLKTYIT